MQTKKSLGQHFLHSTQIIDDIVKAAQVEKNDLILEIGPGEGILTRALLDAGAIVISVEKDERLIPILEEKFTKEISQKQFTLIGTDILTLDINNLITKEYKVVANIPYYITGQIIRMFLESSRQPTDMTLLVQKEVAERIVAKDNKESLLSLSVKVFGNPKLVRTVGKGAFKPPPNVDSAVLVINNISKNKLGDIDEKIFFKILHAGFAHKRKQLLPNLSSLYDKEKLLKMFKECKMDDKCRAEDVSLESWICLCKIIKNEE